MIGIDKICRDGMCRPGGYAITERALAFCGFGEVARLADIGCGSGATVRYIRQHYGMDIYGVEKDPDARAKAGDLLKEGYILAGDAEKLPFGNNEMDGLLFECSLSKMKEPALVLSECVRVLKSDGYLIISDLYARGEPAELEGLLGRIASREMLVKLLEDNGFGLQLFEDHTCSLQELWGQIVFEHGADALCKNLGTDRAGLKRIKCGYCLIVAQKGRKSCDISD